jgi:hypothetical protein
MDNFFFGYDNPQHNLQSYSIYYLVTPKNSYICLVKNFHRVANLIIHHIYLYPSFLIEKVGLIQYYLLRVLYKILKLSNAITHFFKSVIWMNLFKHLFFRFLGVKRC